MIDKYRWYAVAFACFLGAVLVVFGEMSGEQWATVVGSLFGGSAAGMAATSPPK